MKKNKIIIIISVLLLLIITLIWNLIFKSDFIYIFKFWFTILLMGLIFFPITSLIFTKFHDKGWIFSKTISIAISAWFIWLLSNLKILKYTTLNSYAIIFILAIINLIILIIKLKNKNKLNFNIKKFISNFKEKNFKTFKNILITELLFVICFTTWVYIKGFNPVIDKQTEQFMDYGYMNSTMHTEYMPPEDIWLSGNSINYYYFGQYISGFISKISFLNASESYNLMIALIASLTFIMPYIIGYNLFKIKFKGKQKNFNKIIPILLAFIIGISASFGGTLHYPIYHWLSPDKENYTYIDETRYIGYKPDTEDKTATEVPAYSSIVGDLHPHYIDLIFAFTTLALLLQYFLDRKKYKFDILNPNIILIAFILGIEKMTNYWNFPIYLVIISAIIITKNLICNKFSINKLLNTFFTLLGIILLEELVTLPFTLNLSIGMSKVYLTDISSPFYKLAVLWGLPTICIITFLIYFLYNHKKPFKKYLVKHKSDLFIIVIGLCALGLVLIPENIYLKDIYGDEYKRFNTMFKLTYQAYVLLCITTTYITFKFILSKSRFIGYFGILLLFMHITTLGYGYNAITSNYKDKERISITETRKLLQEHLPNDYNAIQWINNNIAKDKIILEASVYSNSYTFFARMSVFTGNPTVLGWTAHEWIWRADETYDIPAELVIRNDDIKNIYETEDIEKAKEIIKKYNISYIYIGSIEYETFENINLNILSELGDIVYKSTNVDTPTCIIEIKK